MKQFLSKSVILIGLMGSGKSTVGKMLSEKIRVPLSDTDKIIEEEIGKEVYQIFNESGEAFFRKIEERVIESVLNNIPHVISTGGGSILSPKTRGIIKSNACSVWIQCDLHLIAKRMLNQEKRPLLMNKNVLNTLIEKNEERIKFYSRADIHVINENPNLEITVETIIENLLSNEVLQIL